MIPFALSVTCRPLTLARAATIALALATGSATFAQPASPPPGPPPAGGLKLPPAQVAHRPAAFPACRLVLY
ncbi:hypothetical protein [Sphingobium sp. HWE2-09]|uniref:hypothetical protein n=1 Tax=Sphingobium sp. HWE2-09 TaxID=3108390 RepID=UPI002DCF83B6|nr:hypothetical protein [Sphingobium sp. HWE2-09]